MSASGPPSRRVAVAVGTSVMTTIAWLGTGLLGAAFVEAALGRSLHVRVFNRTASKTAPLVALGARAFDDPDECVRGVERVHLCLGDDASVDAVLDRALPALSEGVPVIDHSTVSPDGARARARRLGAMRVPYVSAPVFMGPSNARKASGRMLCAGPTAVVESLAPALRAMTGELSMHGEDNGVPCALKLVGNAMIIGVVACLADSLALGTGAGLSAAQVLEFAGAFPFGGIVSARGAKMIQGDYRASFELAMARKDVRLMIESARDKPLAVLPGLAARMDALITEGHGSEDLGALSVDTIPART